MQGALQQAKEAREHILQKMLATIDTPREELSKWAPRMYRIKIPVEKIGAVIGPGGRVIRSIVEETKCTIDVEDDGTIVIGSTNGEAAQRAQEIIEGLTKDVEVGDIYTGKVARIVDFGAFVELPGGKDGLVRIGELADYHVPTVEDVVSLGDEIMVKVIEIDSMGRINLSRRALLTGEDGEGEEQPAGISSDRPPRREGEGERRPRSGGGQRRGGGGGSNRGGGGYGGNRGGQGGGNRGGGGYGGNRGGQGGNRSGGGYGGSRGGQGGNRGGGGYGGGNRGRSSGSGNGGGREPSNRPGPQFGPGPFST
jgi:polyribonucleotide nucleotidyltransferase